MSIRSRAAPAASWLAILILGVADADALSLRSAKAEAFLGDVRPGNVAVSSAAGPLSAENAGTEPAMVLVSASLPPPGKLKDGYDPLPDLGWVRIEGASRMLDPGQRLEPVVMVTVPKERRLEGGQYQFDCLFQGRGPGGGGLTLRTAALLAVGDGDPADAPPEQGSPGFVVSPGKAHVEGVPLGKRAAVRSEAFRALKLANTGESELSVRLTPLRHWPETARLEDGYTPAPNPRWLKTGTALRVRPGEVSAATFELEIPGQKRYRGRKWAFVVAVDVEGGGRRGRSWWTLYVKTSDEEDNRSP